jgi:hypothetical protein
MLPVASLRHQLLRRAPEPSSQARLRRAVAAFSAERPGVVGPSLPARCKLNGLNAERGMQNGAVRGASAGLVHQTAFL